MNAAGTMLNLLLELCSDLRLQPEVSQDAGLVNFLRDLSGVACQVATRSGRHTCAGDKDSGCVMFFTHRKYVAHKTTSSTPAA